MFWVFFFKMETNQHKSFTDTFYPVSEMLRNNTSLLIHCKPVVEGLNVYE